MNNQNVDPGILEYTRTFEAPRALVFRCMTTPEHLTHFWGPTGVGTQCGPSLLRSTNQKDWCGPTLTLA
jgi:uncharacterized protein YndB with AHSA1/START domain